MKKLLQLSVVILILSFNANATITLKSLDLDNDSSQTGIVDVPTSDVACLLGDEMCDSANNLSAQAAKTASDSTVAVASRLFNTPQMFNAVRRAYPPGESEDIKKLIGKSDEAWLTNTCVIRVSYALNNSRISEFRIDSEKSRYRLHVINDEVQPSRGPYAYRVDEFVKYMLSRYGRPTFSKSISDPDIAKTRMPTFAMRNAFSGKKGIIFFVVNFSDATGHFDIWDGNSAAHEDYFSRATHVFLWQ